MDGLRMAARRRRGITLIELVVVLTIILILAAIILTVYMGVVRWSKNKVDNLADTRDRTHLSLADHPN